ncbi:hypothetical protein KR038_008611 [Drosophila bunnanda]|nr:hypothetical protein KR038_008611 [Drosophila bunnanda]
MSKKQGVQRNLLTEAEQNERQKSNETRLHDIGSTCAHFKNFMASLKEIEEQRIEKESWERYMLCDDLPIPTSAADIRTFLTKLQYCDDLEAASSTDWTLSVDERSVLTQNIFMKDLTRKTLEKTKTTSPVASFEVHLRDCLEVLRQVDAVLGNEVEMERVSLSNLTEILKAYGDVQREIEKIFDRLSYRVLSMQKFSMKSIDGIVAMWSHSTDRWRMDLWGLLNVPIIFEQMEVPAMIAELPATGVQVQMPRSILTDCLTVRCVHTSFDHHSRDAKSFELEPLENDASSVTIVDMEEAVVTDLLIQQEIQEEILMKMQQKHEEYMELMQLITERTAMASKKFNENLKIFIPKTPKEVRPIPPGMVPDVFPDFISREQTHYEDYMESYFHPKVLDILPNEINLREHVIVGGIYSLMFLGVPGQTQYQHFNIVLHHDRRVLRITPDVVVEEPEIAGSTRSSRSPSARASLKTNELPYFIVTVKLPPDLCKWGTPSVCYFLTEKERMSKPVTPSLRPSLFESRRMSKDQHSDISSINSNIYSSITKLITRPTKYDEPTDAMDFFLNRGLEKDEMRALATHCLPRIISSFKFPIEFNENEVTELTPKLKRSHFLKRNETPDKTEVAVPEGNYDYGMQEQAERMFPRFPDVVPVQFNSDYNGSPNKQFASGVVGAFNSIKRQYEEKPLDLLQQVEPVTKKDKKLDRLDFPERQGLPTNGITAQDSISKRPSSLIIGATPTGRRSLRKLKKTSSVTTDYVDVLGMVTHWTTKYIIDQSVDPTTDTLTFKTDRLGIFGLAFKRYEHFPFGEWYLKSNENNPDEIVLNLNTQHVSIFFYITSQGVRGYVTDLMNGYIAKPVKYLEIKEPISDFRQLRQTLVDKNINIFAGNDASYYISKGYYSVKHLATEIHTYNTMALHCRSMKFYRSSWNRLAERRDIILNMKIAKDTSDFTAVTARITPEKTTFVTVSELCSDNVNTINLKYEETWRNVNKYVDLNSAILSMNSSAQDTSIKSTMLFIYIKRLLGEIRPLSFA